jgi:hypothetical protein
LFYYERNKSSKIWGAFPKKRMLNFFGIILTWNVQSSKLLKGWRTESNLGKLKDDKSNIWIKVKIIKLTYSCFIRGFTLENQKENWKADF